MNEKQEKLALIAPLVQGLALRKTEVDALLLLPKRNLKALNKKVEDRLNAKVHVTTRIVEPAKPAKLLWAIAKAACPNGERVDVSRKYIVHLYGVQVMGCFAMSKQLYSLANENEPSNDSLKLTGEAKKQ